MIHVKGFAVLSSNYRLILRVGWPGLADVDRWVPIAEALFTGEDSSKRAALYEIEDNAKNAASKVGGVVHRVDRQEA